MRTRLLLLVLLFACVCGPAAAQSPRTLLVGMLTQADDERYAPQVLEEGYPEAPGGRSAPAAEIAVDDSAFTLQGAGYADAKLVPVEAPNAAGVPAALQQLLRQGVHYVVLELPAAGVAAAAAAARGKDVILFNTAAPEDALRGAQCAPNLLHTLPSQAMQADALVQLLVARKWGKALVLVGPTPADHLLQSAFERSAHRFGLKPEEKPFKLSNDPRERDLGNIRLLTSERDYDAVVVLDADGEFARTVPYRTVLPRPVLGSNGVTAQAWSPWFERDGAPQLNHRFERKTHRFMTSFDWATWIAVRAIAEAVAANPKFGVAQQLQALKDGSLAVDGYKGERLTFRAWDGQLRQPVMLAWGNGIADVAPLEGFLHQRTTLDTLGYDAPESACKTK